MGLVRGEDVLLTVMQNEGGTDVYVPFGCARSVTFDISTDFIETSVTDSGNFKTFIPSGKQFSGNIEGLVFINRQATAETNATATIAWNSIYPSYFPSLDSSAVITVDDPDDGSIIICSVSGYFLTYEDFVDAIVIDINANPYNYSAAKIVVSGQISIIITSRPGLGSTMTGLSQTQYNFDGTILYNNTYFSGGVSAYYPDKLGIGWMYQKIIAGERILINYHETDDDNNFLQKNCYVYIESINETASFDNMVTYSASFKGDGTPTINYGEI
jgi:predicted secreted protein